MPVKSITLVGQRFVILPEREYKLLREQARNGTSKRNGQSRAVAAPAKPRRLTAQERGDIAESIRRLKEPGESIPWSRIKAERGL